jgi:peptide/nickel transport system permease protein
MARFLARRIAQAVLVLWLLATATFVAVRLLPGGPAAYMLNPESLSLDLLARIERNLGLEDPLPAQYVGYVVALARGDLGWSFHLNAPVARVIGDRLGPTSLLMAAAFGIALLLGPCRCSL